MTALELRPHPLPAEVLCGLALFGAERGAEVLGRLRDVMTAAPRPLSLAFIAFTTPGDDPDARARRGRSSSRRSSPR